MEKLITKYKSLSIQIKSSIVYLLCTILQKAMSIITLPIFSRVLTKEDLGIFNLYQSWLSLLIVFSSLNLSAGIFANAMTKYKDKRGEFASAMMGLTFTINLILSAILLLNLTAVTNLFNLEWYFVVLLLVEMLILPMFLLYTAKLKFEYKYKKMFILTIVGSVIIPIIILLYVSFIDNTVFSRVMISVILFTIFYGFLTLTTFVKNKVFFNKEFWKYALSFNIVLLPHYLSQTILSISDRILIDRYCDIEDVAMYSLAYSIASLLTIVASSINSAYVPWAYQQLENKKYDMFKNVSVTLFILLVFCIIGLNLFAPELVLILGGSSYHSSVYVIPSVSCTVLFIYGYNIFANIEFFFKKKYFITIASIIAAICNIVLNIIFIPIYGYIAAAYTTLLCYVIYTIVHYIFMKIVCSNNNIPTNLFKAKTLLLFSLFTIFITHCITFIYQYIYLRIIILTVAFVVIVYFRKCIIKILKEVKKNDEN